MTATLPVLERDVQRLITDAAELLSYSWVHWRPAQTAHGWRTPVSGPLGKGHPDLMLVRPATPTRHGRVLFIEVKGSAGRLSPDQVFVHDVLRSAGLEVLVIGPDDIDNLVERLR